MNLHITSHVQHCLGWKTCWCMQAPSKKYHMALIVLTLGRISLVPPTMSNYLANKIHVSKCISPRILSCQKPCQRQKFEIILISMSYTFHWTSKYISKMTMNCIHNTLLKIIGIYIISSFSWRMHLFSKFWYISFIRCINKLDSSIRKHIYYILGM